MLTKPRNGCKCKILLQNFEKKFDVCFVARMIRNCTTTGAGIKLYWPILFCITKFVTWTLLTSCGSPSSCLLHSLMTVTPAGMDLWPSATVTGSKRLWKMYEYSRIWNRIILQITLGKWLHVVAFFTKWKGQWFTRKIPSDTKWQKMKHYISFVRGAFKKKSANFMTSCK